MREADPVDEKREPLRYDALGLFPGLPAAHSAGDASADETLGRDELAGSLRQAADQVGEAWRICKSFMR